MRRDAVGAGAMAVSVARTGSGLSAAPGLAQWTTWSTLIPS